MSTSIRDYASLWFGAGKAGSGGGLTALGGNVLLRTPQHRLDGPEHLEADDTTDLDSSVDRHGLAPKLPGDPTLFWNGIGGFSEPAGSGAMVPTLVPPATTFAIPDNRQALFSVPIVLGAGAGISIGSNAALLEVH